MPSSRTSGRTASCSGAGWTGRFGPVRIQQSRPRPPTCRYRRWGRRMTRRRSSTSSKRPQAACGWPQTDWPVRLIPLLTGEAQLAAQQLPVQNLLVYDDLKRAILQRVGRSPEQHRQRFRSLELGENGRPFVMARQLRDACRRWLLAGEGGVDHVIDQVVLEQFIARLPKATAQWVQCHRPASLDLAIQLAEDQMVACHGVGEPLPSVSLSLSSPSVSPPILLPRSRAGVVPRAQPRWRGGPAPESAAGRAHAREAGSASPSSALMPVPPGSPRQFLVPLPATRVAGKPGPACWRCGDPGHFIDRCPVMEVGTLVRVPDAPQAAPDQAGGYQIPVSIRGGTYWALVDSGCNQTSIHLSLIQPEALDKSCMVRVRCVHGDVVKYPVVLLTIQFRGQKHKVEVAVNPRLRHPLILGTNWPAFKILLGVLCVDASCGKEKPEGEAAVRTGEAEPGPAEAAPGERSAVERLILTERVDFPLEQSQDESLKNAFNQVRSIDGRPLQSTRPPSYPYFAILKDRLYRVTQDAQSKQDTIQLLVPKSRREMLFQAAHCNPMAGHLGQAATLNRLMARFFWPGIHENVRRWCAACRECQLVNPPASPKAPLRPLPLMQVPFERIGMDLIGPLERSARGHRFALVLVDYATRYPEAVALRNISAKSVAEALFSMISRVGIPKEILTDQGTAFMSRIIRELYELLGIKSIRTSVYHPQTDGLVERFNRTLKTMIRKFVHEDESRSDWASPIVLVPKTDGSVRFCVDYRKVNAVSKFDAYPMPRVDELFDRLGTARFYSTLDLTKGYWQIPLSPLSKEKSAFTTPFGLHQFVTLPFGLFGAPATFQRLMDKILRPHTAYAAAYLDDIIIYSQDWQRHMVHLREVLRALRGAGLTANPKKCAIGRVEVRYLGFHLGHGQVRPQIDKTAAIAACPRPKTKKEVRQFLGLAGYYRRFVPDYSELTSPLTDLTKKEVPDTVPWTERCQQVFTQVKAALCGGPLLHSPDFSLPFLLQTDASDRGLGAVLTQEIGGEERPVLYISRKLSKRETMYSTIEKECLAIRWAVLTLRYYLLGREFTLCSDHAPLQWLHRMKDTNARITRWYLALQPFKFKVIHRPGTQMTVADFLSRNGGGGAAGRRASRPESGGGGMWRGGRGSAKSAAGERLRRQR